MKKYLADILTFTRILLALSLIVISFSTWPVGAGTAFIIFIIAELTDAFDGTCARKWPFKKGKEPKYRKYAVKYDMWADALLWFSAVLFYAMRLNYEAAVIGFGIMFGTAIICGVVELIVYGKLFGHPDDCTKNSLCKKNFKLAKKIIMIRRWFYLATIIFVAGSLLYYANFDNVAKVIILTIGVLVLVFLWFFLAQRRKNISRNAEKLEKRMLKK